jgi:unsaturated rhamnogalacturonyl hydrolase
MIMEKARMFNRLSRESTRLGVSVHFRWCAFTSALFLTTITISAAEPSDEAVLASAIAKGKLAANYWVKNSGAATSSDYYADICSYYGACSFGDAQKDSSYYKDINGKYTRTAAIVTDNIDHCSCGILPLHLYLHSAKSNQLQLGKNAADANIQNNGFVRNAIDDTYMTGSLLIQAFRATNTTSYLDFCANFISTYMTNLQQSNGLYWHHRDLSKQFWGRGNGWGAASTAELIQVIPDNHAKHDAIITGYKKQMKGLIDIQRSSGMWQQLLGSSDSRNWEESSGTAMFVFALFTGLRLGILDKETYLSPAKKGWMALATHLGSDGKLNDIAAGFWPSVGDANEYLSASKAAAGNSHGTAGFLWAATAIVRYYSPITNTIASAPFSMYQPHNEAHGTTQVQPDVVFDLRGRKIPEAGISDKGAMQFSGILIHAHTAPKALFIFR